MAFHISKSVSWQAGAGTPEKYAFTLDADVDVVDFTDQVATISIKGTVSATNHPTNSRNSWPASDFAVLAPGNIRVQSYPFTRGTSYYQQALPFLPNGDASKLVAEFRGDTYVSDGNNRVSLWTSQGTINQYNGEGTQSINLNMTFSLPINTSGDTPILTYNSSGANNSTDYNWLDPVTWLSWFELDYRPGQRKVGGTWRSHNRSGGVCDRHGYGEMRTTEGTGNPPSIKKNGAWRNQARIGAE